MKEIEQHRQTEESGEAVLSRLLGLRAWLSTELPCGSFTFNPTLADPYRWYEYDTLDTSGKERKSVKFWEALCYPLVLPFSSTFYKALKMKGEGCICFIVKRLYYFTIWPSAIILAWLFIPFNLMYVAIIGMYSIVFFSDHSITIKLVEDFPQMIMGIFYVTVVRYNREAVFSATISLFVLTRTIIWVVLSVKTELLEEVNELRSKKERRLHRLYGDIGIGNAIWLTTVQPFIMGAFYFWNFPVLAYAVRRRRRKFIRSQES